MVADERHLEGNAGFLGIAQRRADAAVGHRDDEVRLHAMFARELAAHFLANFINAVAADHAVRPREIDVFKNAKRPALVFGKRLNADQTLFVDDDDFARFDITDELGLNLVKRDRFAGQHIRAIQAADGKRAKTERVADANQFLLGHDDERVGALKTAESLHQRVFDAAERRLREHHDDDFAVHGGLKNQPATFEVVAELGGVGQIAVVGDGDLPAHAIHRERLRVADVRRAGGRITRVADGHVAHEVMENFRVKNLRHEPHAMVLEKFSVVAGDDPGAFLPAMLQRVKTVVGEFGGIRMSKNAEHAAIMFGIVLHHLLAPAAELSQTKVRCARWKGKVFSASPYASQFMSRAS